MFRHLSIRDFVALIVIAGWAFAGKSLEVAEAFGVADTFIDGSEAQWAAKVRADRADRAATRRSE